MELTENVMVTGSYGHMICYSLQFRPCLEVLDQQTLEVVVDDPCRGDPGRNMVKVFTTEHKPLDYIQTPIMYFSDLQTKLLHHISASKMDVHLCSE